MAWAHDMKRILIKLVCAISLLVCVSMNAFATSMPQRIVSLNLCTDQLVAEIVSRERLVGVSKLAADPSLSSMSGQFSGVKLLSGTTEEVLNLNPDLVIVSDTTAAATLELLRQVGLRVLIVPMASSFEALRANIRAIAVAVGEANVGEALILDFDDRLRSARSTVASRPTALAYQVNSLVSGPDSLLDEILDAAGYHNLARDISTGRTGRVPLESLVTHPPDLLVFANAPGDYKTVLADNLRHPAIMYVKSRRPSIVLPMPYWLCATPRIADAVEMLASMKSSSFAHVHRVP